MGPNGRRDTSTFKPATSTSPVTTVERKTRKRDVGLVGDFGNLLSTWANQFGASSAGQNLDKFSQIGPNVSNAVAGWVGEGVQKIGDVNKAGWHELFGPGDPPVPLSPEILKQQSLVDQSKAIMPMFEQVQALQESVPLDGPAGLAVQQLHETLDTQAQQLQEQLTLAQTNMTNQNAMFDSFQTAAFGEEGLLPGVDPAEASRLDAALGAGGDQQGVTPELMQALDAVVNSDLTGKAKMSRIDFIMDQAGMQQEQRAQIQDYTQNLADIEDLQNMTDVELLVSQGIDPTFTAPSFQLDLMADPVDRQLTSMLDEFDVVANQQGLQITPAQEDAVGNFLASLPPDADLADPVIANQVNALAAEIGLNPATFNTTLEKGLKKSADRSKLWDNAATQKKLVPGTEEMAIAIFQTAIDKGWPEEMASQVANSAQLHALIQAKSGGDSGAQRGATQIGVGGLSEQRLLAMGYDPKNIRGNMQQGISSLLDYIQLQFGGDPTAALSYYYTTGEWGN